MDARRLSGWLVVAARQKSVVRGASGTPVAVGEEVSSGNEHDQVPDDLMSLEDFAECDMLRALWKRYEQHQIYTWVGRVLVSVNPYQDIGSFSEKAINWFASSAPSSTPHLFSVVRAVLADAPGSRHALLITGESGSGKTEATRAVLQFLALRHAAADHIRERLLRSTPLLEAFGNAQTRQNANSSRFGKFIEVHLSANCEVVGATLRPYMLEASRVVGSLAPGERTYHVFYLLRAALPVFLDSTQTVSNDSGESSRNEKLWHDLKATSEFVDLACVAANAITTSVRLEETGAGETEHERRRAFESLVEGLLGTGLDLTEVAECFRIVAAVAILADSDPVQVELAAKLLGIRKDVFSSFLDRAETNIGSVQRDRFVRSRSAREISTLKASVAQELYATLFFWLTRLVGRSIAPTAAASHDDGGRLIGLLDLYGFEVFSENGFEQFLINFCNERLQQLFNRQVFLREAEEYLDEGLDADGQWHNFAASCTLPALSLLEGELNGTPGLFAAVNDRSRCGFEDDEKGTEGKLLAEAVAAACGKHRAFCHAGKGSQRMFGIRHFAGDVFYDTADFARKNASANRPDIARFLQANGGQFVRRVIEGDAPPQSPELAADCQTVIPGSNPSASSRVPVGANGPRRLFGRTLISVFQQELGDLCSALEARQCRHIRCLRPNDDQIAMVYDDSAVLRQCLYSGLMEASRIRRQGFPHRRALNSFCTKYGLLVRCDASGRLQRWGDFQRKDSSENCRSMCVAICGLAADSGIPTADARVGKTKVFLRESVLSWLDIRRSQTGGELVKTVFLGCVARQRYKRQRAAVLILQAGARGVNARRRARQLKAEKQIAEIRIRSGCHCIQRWWRAVKFATLRTPTATDRDSEVTIADLGNQETSGLAFGMPRTPERSLDGSHASTTRMRSSYHKVFLQNSGVGVDAASTIPTPSRSHRRQLASTSASSDVLTGQTASSSSTSHLWNPHRVSDGRRGAGPDRPKVQLAWSPTRGRTKYGSSRMPAVSPFSPRTKHKNIHQECLQLLAHFKPLCQQLPIEQQGLMNDLSRANDFLACTPPPIAPEEIFAVERCVENVKELLFISSRSSGGVGPRTIAHVRNAVGSPDPLRRSPNTSKTLATLSSGNADAGPMLAFSSPKMFSPLRQIPTRPPQHPDRSLPMQAGVQRSAVFSVPFSPRSNLVASRVSPRRIFASPNVARSTPRSNLAASRVSPRRVFASPNVARSTSAKAFVGCRKVAAGLTPSRALRRHAVTPQRTMVPHAGRIILQASPLPSNRRSNNATVCTYPPMGPGVCDPLIGLGAPPSRPVRCPDVNASVRAGALTAQVRSGYATPLQPNALVFGSSPHKASSENILLSPGLRAVSPLLRCNSPLLQSSPSVLENQIGSPSVFSSSAPLMPFMSADSALQ